MLIALILVGLILAALTVLQALAMRKIRLIHIQTFELLDHARATRFEAENLFGQIQCLGLLEKTLDMHQKLPLMRGWAGSPDFMLRTRIFCVGEGVSVIDRAIDTHVFGLRKKMGDSSHFIETVRGVGYRFTPAPDHAATVGNAPSDEEEP